MRESYVKWRASQLGKITDALETEPMMMVAQKADTAEPTRLHFVEGKAERLPFGDAAFDSVIAVTVLCFVPDAERAVSEMARVLKPG